MGFDECYQLGHIVKTHGLNGEVTFFLDVDHPEEYQNLESVFIDINGKLVPFFIETLHLQGDKAIVALEEIEDINSAKPLVSKELYLPLRSLPKLKAGQYYFHQLPGMKVFQNENLLGIVKDVIQLPNNNLLSVDYQNQEVLIPISDEIVINVDFSDQKIEVNLPEGLLDIYLSSD